MRLLSTRLDGTVIGAYSYDRSSNRLTKTEDTDDDDILESFASVYDRTDALISQTIDNGSPQTFTYDPAGNVTTERTRSGSSRTLAWDARNRLTAITPSSGNAATMTYDPLDRVATRTVTGSTTRTFAYVGASDLAWQVPSGSADARLLTGSDGSQPGVSRSGTAKWLLPDLLGSVALAQPATGSITTSDALRTDAWGTAIGTYPSTGSDLAVRFRGLVDLSPTADPDVSTGTGLGGDALYEMGARTYSPHTGSFSSLDTYPGSAVNPISMSRYLYAHADPATLIDPTGHYSTRTDDPGETPTEEAREHDRQARAETEAARDQVHTPTSTTTSNGTTQWAGGSVAPPVRDDWAGAWSASAGPTAGQAREAMYGACHPRNPRNHPPDCTPAPSGPVDAAALGHTLLDLLGFVDPFGIADGINATWYAKDGDLINATISGASAASWFIADVFLKTAKYGAKAVDAVAGGARGGESVPIGAACSFSALTLVRTRDGEVPISEVEVGDEVLASDETSGTTAGYPVTAVWSHPDPVTGTVEIEGESIAVTPEHPFRTVERGWVAADDLVPGDEIVSLTGASGTVGTIDWTRGPDTMWNLTVATAHTYTVGAGGWLVHNACGPELPSELTVGRNAEEGVSVYLGKADGQEAYVGITNDIGRRQNEHGAGLRIDPIANGLTRGQARAIEQAQLLRARSAGLPYVNRINSISPRHTYYDDAVAWGESWLRANR